MTATTLTAVARLLALHPDVDLARAYAEIAADGARRLLAQARQTENRPNEIDRGLRAAADVLLAAGADKAARELQRQIDRRGSAGAGVAAQSPAEPLLVPDALGRGHDLLATAEAAFAEISARAGLGVRRLDALAAVVGDTWAWPTVAHGTRGHGTAGAG
ncbi:MAG TPA: hypothetical protein DEP69_03455, partial [Acidimicrobiaceae bacterium]|nr:hypothetical protein [Acidimicrobiaceae bacterium]